MYAIKPKTYVFLIERFIFSHNGLNLIHSIVRLILCEGTLVKEEAKVETCCTAMLLLQNLIVVAAEKESFLGHSFGKKKGVTMN